jgi:hypothetical protein
VSTSQPTSGRPRSTCHASQPGRTRGPRGCTRVATPPAPTPRGRVARRNRPTPSHARVTRRCAPASGCSPRVHAGLPPYASSCAQVARHSAAWQPIRRRHVTRMRRLVSGRGSQADVSYFVFSTSPSYYLPCIQIICPFRSSRRARRNGVVQIGI